MSDYETDLDQSEIVLIGDGKRYNYPREYVEATFLIWYRNGRPGGTKLHRFIPVEPKSNLKPSVPTLSSWIYQEDWKKKADLLDEAVAREVEKTEVARRYKMIQEHAEQAKEAREIAFDWIRNNIDEFTAASAVRLFFEAAQMERESVGLDNLIEDVHNLSDDQIKDRIKKLVHGSKMDIDLENTLLVEEEDADYESEGDATE